MIRDISIMEEDWDYLIILDACRYDYFSKVYKDYFRGEIKKVLSQGSSTVEWCIKSFPRRYEDVVYISANPYINSEIEVKGFDAKNHFYKVIDVWDWGWNNELGTVHPKKVNEAVRAFKDNYPNKRFIIHYLQPHSPYISGNLNIAGYPHPEIRRGRLLDGIQSSSRLFMTKKILLQLLSVLDGMSGKLFGRYSSWKIRELLNLPPANHMDAARRRVGLNGLRAAYEENLRFVLEYVAKLAEDLSGVIMVTSDHGERLGEGGKYSHFGGLSDLHLIEVPLLKVGNVIRLKNQYYDAEKRRIKQRIKQMKAMSHNNYYKI